MISNLVVILRMGDGIKKEKKKGKNARKGNINERKIDKRKKGEKVTITIQIND
jgi:hypothetical protein